MIWLAGVRDLIPRVTSHTPRQGELSGLTESPDHHTGFWTCLITTGKVETQVRSGLAVVSPCVSLFQWHLILLSNTSKSQIFINSSPAFDSSCGH